MATVTPLAANNISYNNLNHRYYKIDGVYYYFEYPDGSKGPGKDTSYCIIEGGTGTTQMTAGSSPGSPKNVVNKAASNGNQNTVFVNCNSGTTGVSSDIVDELAGKTNGDRTNRVYMGHSASGFQVTNAAYNYLKKEHDDGKETKTMLVLNDPTYGGRDDRILNGGMDVDDFEDSYVVSMGPASLGYSGKISENDLTSLAQSGARVLLIGGPTGWHTEYNDKLSPALGLYDQHSVNLSNYSGLTFWTLDSKGNPVKLSLKEAQEYNDSSVGRLGLFNHGYLTKQDGEYVLQNSGFSFVITNEQLEKLSLDFERSGLDFNRYILDNYNVDKDGNLYDKNGNKVATIKGAPNNDNVPPSLAEVGKACEALLTSLGDIGRHMKSFGNIKGLDNKAKGGLSDFLSSMNAFPSGVSTAGLQTSMECVNKLGSNLEEAYNAAANLYDVMDSRESAAKTYYPSSTYSNAGTSASANVGNFADSL